MLTDLPLELLLEIVEGLVREYLFEFFTSHDNPWNAIATLRNVSPALREVTHSLLASSLLIGSVQDGRLAKDPVVALWLARKEADKRFDAGCVQDGNESSMISLTEDDNELVWWKDSPLLELYSVIREIRFKSDWITEQGHHLRRLADLPKTLVDPMEKVKASKDKRLIRPALVEGAYLIACTSFVGQLSASARFFDLVHAVLSEEPEWVFAWFDNIEKTLLSVECLEKNCTIPLRWVHIDRPKFVNASHIYASRIVPALSNFLNTPVITSDPKCARWRRIVDVLLKAWAPLDDEVHEEITKKSTPTESQVMQTALLEFPQDVTP